MGKQSDNDKYLANCAKTFQGQLGLHAEQFKECKNFGEVVTALEKKKSDIYERFEYAPPEQIGKLAYMHDPASVEIAAVKALIPALATRILADLNPKRFVKCKFCDFVVVKFARGRRGNAFDMLNSHIKNEHPREATRILKHSYGSRTAREAEETQQLIDKFGPDVKEVITD